MKAKIKHIKLELEKVHSMKALEACCSFAPDSAYAEAMKKTGWEVQYSEKVWERTEHVQQYLFYKNNNSNVLAIVHLDTVRQEPWAVRCALPPPAETMIYCPKADDRAGLYVVNHLLPKFGIVPDILLTTGEEIGRSTAQFFKPPEGKVYNWMFQFDRRGTDVVMYQYDNHEMRKLLKENGFDPQNGAMSDIGKLEKLGCKGFNFGVGYSNNHDLYSVIFEDDMLTMVANFIKFYLKYRNSRFAHKMAGEDIGKGRHSESFSPGVGVVTAAKSTDFGLPYGMTMLSNGMTHTHPRGFMAELNFNSFQDYARWKKNYESFSVSQRILWELFNWRKIDGVYSVYRQNSKGYSPLVGVTTTSCVPADKLVHLCSSYPAETNNNWGDIIGTYTYEVKGEHINISVIDRGSMAPVMFFNQHLMYLYRVLWKALSYSARSAVLQNEKQLGRVYREFKDFSGIFDEADLKNLEEFVDGDEGAVSIVETCPTCLTKETFIVTTKNIICQKCNGEFSHSKEVELPLEEEGPKP